MCGLDGGVHGQQVGLTCNLGDDVVRLRQVTGLLRHVVDLPGNIILTLPTPVCNSYKLLVLLCHLIYRVGYRTNISHHLFHGGGGLYDARRLIFYQAIQIPHTLNAILQNHLHLLQCLVLLYNLMVHIGNVGGNLLCGAGGLLCGTSQILCDLRNCLAGFSYILHDVLLVVDEFVYLPAHGTNLILPLDFNAVG